MTETRSPLTVPAGVVIVTLLGVTITLMVWALAYLQQSETSSLTDDLERLRRLQSIAAFEPRLAAIEGTQDAGRLNDLFLTGGTQAELSAALQARINALAMGRGVQVLRTSDTPRKTYQSVGLIGADVEMSGPGAAVYALLGDIEAEMPPLVVNRLSLRTTGPPEMEESGDIPLSVSMQVLGATKPLVPDNPAK